MLLLLDNMKSKKKTKWSLHGFVKTYTQQLEIACGKVRETNLGMLAPVDLSTGLSTLLKLIPGIPGTSNSDIRILHQILYHQRVFVPPLYPDFT